MARIERKRLGNLMLPWGGDSAYGEGIGAVGAVGSFYFSGKPYPKKEFVERALRAVEKDLPLAERGLHGWGKREVKELKTIARGLEYFLKADY